MIDGTVTSALQTSCALCLNVRLLCVSHIVPNSYFKSMKRRSNGKLIEFDSDPGTNVRLTQESLSEDLLCHECEQKFSAWEGLCIEQIRRLSKTIEKHKLPGAVVEKFDFETFRYFLLSVLWRASVSMQMHFRGVQLDPNSKESLRVSLDSLKPLRPHQLGCRIRKLVDRTGAIPPTKFEAFAMNPHQAFDRGRAVCTFYFGGCVIDFFIPGARFKDTSLPGFVRDKASLYVPIVSMQDVPMFMHALAHGYGKHQAGQVEPAVAARSKSQMN